MNSIEFARNLFALRTEHGFTIEALAQELGVSPETVCEWECAKTSPSLENTMSLSRLYGVPLDEIIRTPKPHEIHLPEPVPVPEEAPAPEPEPAPAPETEELPVAGKHARRKRKPAAWEIILIVLAVLLIAFAAVWFCVPGLFPFLPSLARVSALAAAPLL